jgi:hypothetical protein
MALKSKLPALLKEGLGDEKIWPVKFKGKISSLRLISPKEAKLTIRLEYVPPDANDTPPPAGGGGAAGGFQAGGGGPGGGGFQARRSPNQVVFIYLKFFDGVWTTNQAGAANTAALQNGINHLMAAIDEIADQEAGK